MNILLISLAMLSSGFGYASQENDENVEGTSVDFTFRYYDQSELRAFRLYDDNKVIIDEVDLDPNPPVGDYIVRLSGIPDNGAHFYWAWKRYKFVQGKFEEVPRN